MPEPQNQPDDAASAEAGTQAYEPSALARARAVLDAPPEQIGPYRILERLGGGGMGDVYRAEQRGEIRREVAIKLIKPGFDTRNVIARFEVERQAMAMMDDPHIAKVFDAGKDDTGRPYFVMEYVPGQPVTRFADDNKLTVRQRLELFLQVCSAISHAHTKLIIHRDIKSGNVLGYFDAQQRPTVKVIDFGIAKALSGRALSEATLFTAYGAVLGTYDAMSPEQAEGSLDVDTRTDVYSLGVLLYELLSGVKPFDYSQAADLEIRRVIREDEPPPPSTRLSSLGEAGQKIAADRRSPLDALAKELSSELDWIPLMAMRKERDRRYPSAAELSADVERYLEGRPLLAGPESMAYRLKKYISRRKGAVAAIAAIVVLLVGGTLISSLLAVRARRAERQVQDQIVEVEQEKTEAQHERDQSVEANQRANRMLSEMCVDTGIAAMDSNEAGLAMLWFIRAMKFDAGDPDRQVIQRRRISALYLQHPRSVNIVPPDVPRIVKNGLSLQWDSKGVKVVDARTGKPIGPPIDYDPSIYLYSARLSPDTKYVVTCSTDGTRIWEVATGKAVTPPIPRSWKAEFSPDSKHLATMQTVMDRFNPEQFSEATVQVWDISTGRPVTRPLTAFKQPSSFYYSLELKFGPDGKRLLSGAYDTWRLWDAETGELLFEAKQSGIVHSAVFSPDGSLIATASGHSGEYGESSDFVVVRDATNGNPVAQPIARTAEPVGFSDEGKYLVTTGPGNRKETWNLDAANPASRQIQYGGWWGVAEFSPDGKRIFVSAEASNDLVFVRLLDAANGEPLVPPMMRPHMREAARKTILPFIGISFICGGQFLDVGGISFDCETGHSADPPLQGDPQPHPILTSPYQRYVFASQEDTAGIWDAQSGKVINAKLAPPKTTVAFSPDETRLAIDGKILELPSGKLVCPLAGWDDDKERSIEFSADGKYIVSECGGTQCALWNAATGQPVFSVEHGLNQSHYGRLSPDGVKLCVATQNGEKWNEARIWDVASGKTTAAMRSNETSFYDLAFSNNGKYIITGDPLSAMTTVRVWDAINGKPVARLVKNAGAVGWGSGVHSARFSPDGNQIVTVDGAQAIIWDYHCLPEPIEQLELLAEYLSGSRIDEVGGLVTLTDEEIRTCREKLLAESPELFQPPVVAPEKKGVSEHYRKAVQSQVAATTNEARKELSVSFSHGSHFERHANYLDEAILLAETAVKLDDSNLDAYMNLAAAYLMAQRYEDALAIYEKYKGRHHNGEWYNSEEKDIVFGQHAPEIIAELRNDGHDSPTLAKIEAVLAPTLPKKADQPKIDQPAKEEIQSGSAGKG